MTNAHSVFEVDKHWGVMEPGEAARMIGAGDPNEITSGAQPDSGDIGD